MKEIDFIPINQKQYEEIIGCIRELTAQSFYYLNLADDIANTILVRLMKSSIVTDPTGNSTDYIKSVFPKAVEAVFSYYHKVSLQYCLSKTQDHNLSEDTSQEAIMQLLSSKYKITDVYSWLRQVTHNLLCKYYEFRAKEQELYNCLRMESSVLQNVMACGNTIDIEGLNTVLKQEILASPEYREYESLVAYENIRDYAASLKVSEKVAQKRKERVIRNLRAKMLITMGWEASHEILNYNQYNAIQKFIRELLKDRCVKTGGACDQARSLGTKLSEVMQEIPRIEDWGITMLGRGRFRIHLFHLTPEKKPIIVTLYIALNERNHITIEDFKKHDNVQVHPIPSNVHIPKEMGKALWSYEKIISLLNT